CGLLVLEAENMVAVVHAGWRGLLAGVVENAVATMRAEGATDVHATLGPAIGPECYAFGEEPMADMVAKYGDRVRSQTRDGHLALDLFEGIHAACDASGATFSTTGICTGCSDDHYSFRDPSKAGNQVVAAWLEA
ncbi:MAG: laccase domain-containing protein, partial [Acidimicrobiales bacterium]|nr:laccase domain-containing protein [Acidimicrobiales bacterium]